MALGLICHTHSRCQLKTAINTLPSIVHHPVAPSLNTVVQKELSQ